MRYAVRPKVGEANAALCACCIAFTFFAFMAPAATTRYFVGDSFAIYDGQYWLLILNVTVHGGPIHLIFNLMWLWLLGNAMEEAMGSARYMTFVAGSAYVACGFQMISSVSTGIGISGVICAMAGFMWAARRDVPMFGMIMPDQRLRQLIIILLVMIPLDRLIPGFRIAHYAHFGGLAFGLAVGRASSHEYTRQEHLQGIVAVIILVGFVSTSIIWAPWSKSWLAYQDHKRLKRDIKEFKDYDESQKYRQEKLLVEAMKSRIQIVNSEALPLDDRLTAMRQLALLPRSEVAKCFVANVSLGDDGTVPLAEVPAVVALAKIGKVSTPAILVALEGPLEPRPRRSLVYALASVESPKTADQLIERRMAKADEDGKARLAQCRELLQRIGN